jgi:hypothetical protein
VNAESQTWYGEVNNEYPVVTDAQTSELLKSFGEFKSDSLNLSRLGENNRAAVQLMDRAGWRYPISVLVPGGRLPAGQSARLKPVFHNCIAQQGSANSSLALVLIACCFGDLFLRSQSVVLTLLSHQ